MPGYQKQRQPRARRQAVLDLRPASRGVFPVFCRYGSTNDGGIFNQLLGTFAGLTLRFRRGAIARNRTQLDYLGSICSMTGEFHQLRGTARQFLRGLGQGKELGAFRRAEFQARSLSWGNIFDVWLTGTDSNTRGKVGRFYFDQFWFNFAAHLDRKWTTCMEPATSRRINGGRHIALEHDALTHGLYFWIGNRNG